MSARITAPSPPLALDDKTSLGSVRPHEKLKAEIVQRATELGFASCRVARAETPRHAYEFREWLRDGAAGTMEWLHRGEEKRCDPALVLPGARSVIVVAMNYWQGTREAEPGTTRGRIARYAWGDDYHDLMLERLRSLDALLIEHGGTQKCYVDTGPILERNFAAEAGVGWQGKSTMLLDPKLGTWFFLGEILTTLDLAPDAPQPARCGSCTRCITACPTGAITDAHRLDARRCISYLTIELKGSIPLEFRPLIGDRIYGCDTCLDVCPWNRFASVSREAAFAAREPARSMQLRDYLALSEEEFRTLFHRSPIKRIKRRGLLRNVCVALGNVGTGEDLAALERAALDPEPLIAEHAAWALSRVRSRLRGSRDPAAASAGELPSLGAVTTAVA
ncbi:MAG: Iron-sulfur cluster-binding protein [uncultured Chthoniobacterales bacterium]|uniref:Epoxyqueuosine reductase n=1 Tax=uncultured Chthoniobacterales bacterium TaxID=1836801 RepID=A0A6J4IYI9_9BACT|nr:MAG: Iron-sulfur cluster-binding protein [uncultured Chthoniobacterales bacterium]